MAVVSTKYIPNKATGEGAFRESHILSETWLVRVDAPPPTTSVAAILTAPGMAYGTAHPSFSSCKAMKWSYAAADGSGLVWSVTVQFFVPIVDINPATGLPADVWSGRGANIAVPFYKDKNGDILTNSAGDPMEGMERELCFRGYTLVRSYASLSAADAEMNAVNNKTNSDTWPTLGSYGTADTWKCSIANFSKKVIVTSSGATQTAARYWEVTYELDYRDETWHNKPWDMGFNERTDASGVPTSTGTKRRAILGVEGRPVKQPVALASGVALPPGTPPVALDFDPYSKVSFATKFGDPS
jgi:hypothetical protein